MFLLAGVLSLTLGSTAFAECSPKKMGFLKIEVIEEEDDTWAQKVVVRDSEKELYNFEFDRLGGGGCVSLFTLPKYSIFGVHWDEGSAGTSTIYARQMLYLWKIINGKTSPIGGWVLHEEDDDDILVDRTYTFLNGRLNLEGTESFHLDQLTKP